MWLSQPPTQKASVEEAADEDVWATTEPSSLVLHASILEQCSIKPHTGELCGSALNERKLSYLYIVNFSWKKLPTFTPYWQLHQPTWTTERCSWTLTFKVPLPKHHTTANPGELGVIGKSRIYGQYYCSGSCACTKTAQLFPGQYTLHLGQHSAVYSAK